jgi:hypothetical protein
VSSPVVLPVGKRPHCLYCDKELRPNYDRASMPWRLSDEERREWRKANPRVFDGTYGHYNDNFFCGLTCGHQWAVKIARQGVRL